MAAQEILIETAHAALRLEVDEGGKLYQRAFGAKDTLGEAQSPAYPASGDGWVFEAALEVIHFDGNSSTDLRVMAISKEDDLCHLSLKDPEYAFWVELYFRVDYALDVLETWTEIRSEEPGEVQLSQFASSFMRFGDGEVWLTQFHGDWANEVNMSEEKLTYGIKSLESKLVVRAHQFTSPWFMLSQGGPAAEDSGEVLGGSLAWSGSFAMRFEVDPTGRSRAICGINPNTSSYRIGAGETFKTPRMIWAWSGEGAGKLSRNLHQWVRVNALRDGHSPRSILLNNWEATYFNFDESKIVSLMDGAKALGMELFLLDDGWFGDKYPRNDDSRGLGDWAPDIRKAPRGIKALTDAAKDRDLRFGIWLEPEMVNPKSEQFEEHPNWVIQQPKRALDLHRNQMVLDLTQPEVRDFVFQVADKILSNNPDISYVKWDCNRYLTQPGSPGLPPGRGTHLSVDYVWSLYDIFDRIAKNHPSVEIMMCSGGGGRVDYEAMRYAHEFWPSDMTDPVRRIFIQWGYSYFFPAIAISSHVTMAGGRPLKFAFDVAMSGRLGMDVDLDGLSEGDKEFAKRAINSYKSIREVVQLGQLFRLESPYDGERSSLMYVHERRSVVFAFSRGKVRSSPIRLKGLHEKQSYLVGEINSSTAGHETLEPILGQELMKIGLPIPQMAPLESLVFELTRL